MRKNTGWFLAGLLFLMVLAADAPLLYIKVQSGSANNLKSTNETDYGTLTIQGNAGFPGSSIYYATNGANYAELRANKDVPSNSTWVLPTNGMAGNTVGLLLSTNTGASTGQLSVVSLGTGLNLNAAGTSISATDPTGSNALRGDIANLQGGTNGLAANKVNVQSGSANSLTSTGLTVLSTIGGTANVLAVQDTNSNVAFQIKSNNASVIVLGTNANGWTAISNNASATNCSIQSGGNAPSVYIGPGGNVGIGTNAPQQALAVQGNLGVTGNNTNTGSLEALDLRLTGASGILANSSSSTTITLGAGGLYKFSNRSTISCNSVNGIILFQNAAGTDFTALDFGGTTAAFPALGRTNGDLVILGGDGLFGGGETNRLKVFAGGSSALATVGGTLSVQTTPIANAGTAQTNLITYSVPANTLTNNGDRIVFSASGRFAANTDAKELLVIFGSETVLDTTSQIVNSGSWTLKGEIIRTGNTSQTSCAEFNGAGFSLFTDATASTLAQTNGIATTLAIAATCAGSGDATNRTLIVNYFPSP